MRVPFLQVFQWGFLLILLGCSTSSSQKLSRTHSSENDEMESIARELKEEEAQREKVEGDPLLLNKSSLENTLKKHLTKFKECYLKEIKGPLKGAKKREGPLILVFTLKENGQTQRVGVEENEFPLELKSCLLEVLWKIKFPPLKGTKKLDVRLPVNFSIED